MVKLLKIHNSDKKIVAAIVVLIFIFLGLTGTLFSGFHFTDDHEIIRMVHELKTESAFNVAANWVRKDLDIRFRPVYYIHRVFEARLFSNNFLLWSVWTAILACITISLSYLAIRKMKYTISESLLFILIAFVGPQMAIWWRLGPNETIGMFFMGLSLNFMVNCEKRHFLNTFLFCLFLIFSSWCKESFTIAVPAFIIFKLWHEFILFGIPLKNVLYKNKLLILPILVMVVNLSIILFWVGTNKIGYAGVDTGFKTIVIGILKTLFFSKHLSGFIALCSILTGFLYFKYRNSEKGVNIFNNLRFPFVFAFFLVVPNIILYAKSGMSERYLLPSTIGFSFFIVCALRSINGESRRLHNIMLSCVLLFMIYPVYNMIVKSVKFGNEGLQTSRLLSVIVENSSENTKSLLVVNPADRYEWTFSLNKYLSILNNSKIYVYPANDVYKEEFKKRLSNEWHSWFEGREYEHIKGDVDLIIFFDKDLIDLFFKDTRIDLSKYVNLLTENDYYTVYKKIKKN